MKKVLITGCSKGIGYETCKLFYENDWKVYGTCTTERGINKLEKEFPNGIFYNYNFLYTDVCEFISRVNIKKICFDLIINNAAIKYDLENTFKLNVDTPFIFMEQFPKSKFINIISDIVNINHPNLPEYKASKHALDGLSKSFRAKGMRVSCVYPGLTNTTFNKRKGGMNPKEVAKAIYFVAISKHDIDLYIGNE